MIKRNTLKNKSKCLFFFFLLRISTDPTLAQSDPIVSLAIIEPSQRKINKLPASLNYKRMENGKYSIIVNGIADNPATKPNKYQNLEFYQTPMDSLLKSMGVLTLETNQADKKCIITTSKEINLEDLSSIINTLSKVRGDIPCWDELEARDFQKSQNFRDDHYHIQKISGEIQDGLAWFWIPKNRSYCSAMAIKSSTGHGYVIVVPSPYNQGDSPHYIVRILDQSGHLYWMSPPMALGTCRIALGDIDRNGEHELYLICTESKVESRFCIKPT